MLPFLFSILLIGNAVGIDGSQPDARDFGWTPTTYAQFQNLTLQEIAHRYMGAFEPTVEQRLQVEQLRAEFDLTNRPKIALPREFDAAERWPECAKLIQKIRDQSSCGSCWAVATANALSDRLCIHSRGAIQAELSAQDPLECCYQCGYQCLGGYIYYAHQYFQSEGIVTGGNYADTDSSLPYAVEPCTLDDWGHKWCPPPQTGRFQCRRRCQNRYTLPFYRDKTRGQHIVPVQDEADMMEDLVRFGPFVTQFRSYEDLLEYRGGVYEHSYGNYIMDHVVRIVGYGVDERGVKYWKAANTWGPDFGEQGFFRIRRGVYECNIEKWGFSMQGFRH